MDWGKIASTLAGEGLSLLGGILGGPAGAAAGSLVARALGVGNTPDAVTAALATDPRALVKLRELEMAHEKELTTLMLNAEAVQISETNATARAEVASNDAFVRRMRPMFGYALMLTIVLEALIAAWVALMTPANLPDLATLFTALATPQSIALAVLGIYIKKRSDEKMAAAPATTGPGLLAGLVGRLADGGSPR